MKNIKLVATDADGTLLGSNHEVSEANINEINRLTSLGIEIVVCTGRPLHEVPEVIFEHPEINYVISANGAIIYDLKKEKIIKSNYMNKEILLDIIKTVEPYDCALTLSTSGHLFSNSKSMDVVRQTGDKEYANFFENSREVVDNLEDIVHQHPDTLEKINFNFKSPEERNKIIAILKSIDGIHITASFGYNLEVNDEKAQKGLAVDYLRKQLNLDLDQVVTIGDNLNDVSMLELTKHSFAMGNATDEVKKIAKHITATNDEDGVAKVLRQIH